MLAVLSAAVVAVFWPTLFFDFIYDDQSHITSEPLVHAWNSLFRVFFVPTKPGDLYRPVSMVSFGVTWALFGRDPLPFHLTNILIHIIVCSLFYALLKNFFAQKLAACAALLFALHPLHAEVVSVIYNRTESLAALFGLSTLLVLLPKSEKQGKGKSFFRYLCAALLFFAALCSKESALSFIPISAALILARHGLKGGALRATFAVASLSTAVIFYFALRVVAAVPIGTAEINYIDNFLKFEPAAPRILYALALLGRYLYLCIVPSLPRVDYSYPVIGLGSVSASLPEYLLLLGVAAILVGIMMARGKKEGVFGVWFFCGFLVTANIFFPIGTAFAERLAYVPSMGVCAVVAALLFEVPYRHVGVVLFGVLLVASSYFCVRGLSPYENDNTLWKRAAEQTPDNVRAQHYYSIGLLRQSDLSNVIEHESIALSLYPEFIPGRVLVQRALEAEGSSANKSSIVIPLPETNPQYTLGYEALGWDELKLSELDAAARDFKKALQFSPHFQPALLGLYTVALKQSDSTQALALRDKLSAATTRDPRFQELRSAE